MLVLSLLVLPSSGLACRPCLFCNFDCLLHTWFVSQTSCQLCFSIVSHITLIIPSSSLSGVLSNAGPLPGTTKNLHFTHLSLYLIFTAFLPSCSIFDQLCILSTIHLFIIAFNSAITDPGNISHKL